MAHFEKNDTFTKVREIIADKISVDPTAITAQSTFQSLGADSLDIVEIIMKLEEQFGMEINDEEAEKMVCVNDVVEYIHQLRTK